MDKLCLANLNVFWGGLIAETLARLGLKYAVVSPGSRSAPLTLGLATCSEIEAIPVLDERSAGFLALGLIRRTGKPVALVCTSGTAAANYLPAVVEAQMSGLPLVVLTADRPPEMRDCASGQTIDQRKIYGDYPVWEHELSLPGADRLRYLRQTLRHGVRRSLTPLPGPVHLNVPFRDPLAPVKSEEPFLPKKFDVDTFLADVRPTQVSGTLALFDALEPQERGLIVAGYTQVDNPPAYAEAVLGMARQLGWPVLADVLSPLRSYAPKGSPLVCNYHALLRDRQWADKHRPDFVLQFGDLPTSKILRNWLAQTEAETLVIDGSYRNLDSAHARATHLRLGDDAFAEPLDMRPSPLGRYANDWLKQDQEFSECIQKQLRGCEMFFEGKLPWLLSRRLPEKTPVFIAASMPVRDAELFWQPSERGYAIHANRGANGIDGTLSTALGLAHGGRPAVLLTGDLAFLHDSNGLLSAPRLRGSLTVILINNGGGRIFENLAIREFDPPFEEFFATPQQVDFEKLAAAHGIEYLKPKDWPELDRLVSKLPREGVRIIEVVTDAADDVPMRKELLNALGSPEGRAPKQAERPAKKKSRSRRRPDHREDSPPSEKKDARNAGGDKSAAKKAERETPNASEPTSDAPPGAEAKEKPARTPRKKSVRTPQKKRTRREPSAEAEKPAIESGEKASAPKRTRRRKSSSESRAESRPDESPGG